MNLCQSYIAETSKKFENPPSHSWKTLLTVALLKNSCFKKFYLNLANPARSNYIVLAGLVITVADITEPVSLF